LWNLPSQATGANYLGFNNGWNVYAIGNPTTAVGLTSAVNVMTSAGIAVRFEWTASSAENPSIQVATSTVLPVDQGLDPLQFQLVAATGTLQLTPGDWQVELIATTIVDAMGGVGTFSMSDFPFPVRAGTVVSAPTPPISATLVAPAAPVELNTNVPTPLLPAVTFSDMTPTTYIVNRQFAAPAIVNDVMYPADTVITTPAIPAPAPTETQQTIAFPFSLRFTASGVIAVSATIDEGTFHVVATPQSAAVYDDYSMSGKGSSGSLTKIDFSVNLQRGAPKGKLKFELATGQFTADPATLIILQNVRTATCTGSGTWKPVTPYTRSFSLTVHDEADAGAGDTLSLSIDDIYTSSAPQPLDAPPVVKKRGDITVSSIR
jgi:hypothetical protein